jgi:PadR family transcriptional regulator, regulatory protein AphA
MESEQTPTAYVILGMIKIGRRTGYDIKQMVDFSTRFFWAASYGQIYPELKRLEETGLIDGESDPRGGRKRRTYTLTPAGEDALERWLTSATDPLYEVRDEALLRLFFAGALAPEDTIAVVQGKREFHEGVLARLQELEPSVRDEAECPYLVLRYGIAHHGWIVEWCRQTERELALRAAQPAAEA